MNLQAAPRNRTSPRGNPAIGSACNARTRDRYAVLVVDDSAAVRYATSRALKHAGFHVVEAAGGAQALQLGAYVSAVVLDVHLPDVSGIEVCRLLRTQAATSRLAIVHASSVYREPMHEDWSRAAGADAYLVTPINPDILVAAVEAAINARTTDE